MHIQSNVHETKWLHLLLYTCVYYTTSVCIATSYYTENVSGRIYCI